MVSLRKYFLHGAVGLIFGQAVGLFIPTLFMGIKIMLVLQLAVVWGIFGFYIGLLWNKGLKFGILGIVSGILGGIIWYRLLSPPFSIWGAGFFLPGILFCLFFVVSALLKHKLTIKNMLLFTGAALSVIPISVFAKYYTILGNKFTGVIPPLIGFFYFLISFIILGGLIGIGFYYLLGSIDTSKNALKNAFLNLGKIVSVIWILFMFVFALGASQDVGYFIKKVNETEFFVVVDANEINIYPDFAKAINDIEKGKQVEYSRAVPREEWNALRNFFDQKKCRSKTISGLCYYKINNSFYEIGFWMAD